tara:strand:- start:683 stop:1309 length:627 start_codon:yes stop_codon:yes gene_type:complete
MIIKKLIVPLLFITFLSCLEEKEPAPYLYKIELNPMRKQLGLRIIDTMFYSSGRYDYKSMSTFDKVNKVYGSSYMKLKHKYRRSKSESAFFEKFIKLDKKTGKPQFEEDRHRSGLYKYGFNEGGNILESLSFRYVFEDYRSYDFKSKDSILVSKGWYYIYEYPIVTTEVTSNRPEKDKNGYWERKTEQLNEKQADSILYSWDLKRLNY